MHELQQGEEGEGQQPQCAGCMEKCIVQQLRGTKIAGETVPDPHQTCCRSKQAKQANNSTHRTVEGGMHGQKQNLSRKKGGEESDD
mmetsp:Transcript_58101/g.96210  ORF Transcript_58101/g.96210 Transcript_58101/m.96210 type:complete len:86 (+) Transcript_58101:482-739(+)